nr:hypothetical protein BaRGS_000124 [Batillaria attramentaria]
MGASLRGVPMELVLDVHLWEEFLESHGYDLLGLIDSGSFSDVFAVRKRSTDQVLAVKRMVARRHIQADPRVAAEISCLTELGARGACVIHLEQAILMERVACLVLEMAPLGDLERHAQLNWPLSERLVTSAVRQVLSALAHCHRLDIAHRDLNPANVLLVTPHSVRLADFGLAVRCRDADGNLITCEDCLGRESYLAPEVLHCSPYHAMEADLWDSSLYPLVSVDLETHDFSREENNNMNPVTVPG